MVTAVLSVGREDANRHASCRADDLTISASIRSRNLLDARDETRQIATQRRC